MIQAVLNICTSEQKNLINFILENGARINEALNLKGRDVLNAGKVFQKLASLF